LDARIGLKPATFMSADWTFFRLCRLPLKGTSYDTCAGLAAIGPLLAPTKMHTLAETVVGEAM
jgi:hypothetical protein